MVTTPSVPVLERTLATTFVPGSNRRGEALGASWTLLLDDLQLGHVVCLGMPGERSLRTLARHARAVTLVCVDRRGSRLVRRRLDGLGFGGVASVSAADVSALGGVDLMVVTSARWARRAAADDALTCALLRSGAVYAQLGLLDAAVPTTRPSVALWLGVADGEVSLAAGLGDDAAIALLRRPGAASRAVSRRPSATRLARQLRQRPRLREHVGTLAGLGSPSPGTGVPVPAYVRDIAEAAGERVDGFRVALTAPGDYPSRKPVLALFAPGARAPRYVVKLAHDVALNERLENEARALRSLAALGIGDAATVPRAAFAGRHAGHAVLGQTAITGVPFRQVTSATPDCPAAGAALAWLTELGARTADPSVAEPSQVAGALGELLERFARVYRPTAAEREALAGQVAAVAASRYPFPLVYQHGDAGTWNLLVTTDGRPAFLDWEAAELHGMPMWDLFYFARSVAVGVARASGTRGSLEGFARAFLPDGPMSRTLGHDLTRHAAQIGLDPALVEPLLLTCWMHRALKEATTLRPAHLARGRYIRLLRLCLEQRDAPGLRRLCGSGQDGVHRRP